MAEGEIEAPSNTIDNGILRLPGEGIEAATLSVGVELIRALQSGVKAGKSEKNGDIIFEIGNDRTSIVGEGFGIDGGRDSEPIKICHIGIDNNDCGHSSIFLINKKESYYSILR